MVTARLTSVYEAVVTGTSFDSTQSLEMRHIFVDNVWAGVNQRGIEANCD